MGVVDRSVLLEALFKMASFQNFGIVLCVGLLVVLPPLAECRTAGSWKRLLKQMTTSSIEEDYPSPTDYPYPSSEEDEAVPLHPSPNRIGWIEGEIPVNLDDVEEGNVGGCGGGIYWTGLCDYTKNEILRLHNKYRATVAMGRESRGGGLPAASDMREMEWDESLEAHAHYWAATCPSGHSHTSGMGENIHWGCYRSHQDKSDACDNMPQESLTGWFDKEIKYFHPYYIDPFKYKSAFGHMSQVAWAKSDKLGCGLAHFNKAICGDSFPYSTVVVCNYGPQGNVIGGTMYEKGDPCTSCASYDVHCYNHGLCGP